MLRLCFPPNRARFSAAISVVCYGWEGGACLCVGLPLLPPFLVSRSIEYMQLGGREWGQSN